MPTEKARSVVELDGKQAEEMLDLLKTKAQSLRAEMNKAFAANDLDGFKKAQSELAITERSMKSFKKASFDADAVLKNLSGSTLKDLNKAQTAITNQLRSMARGSEEYIARSKDLQSVRKEISAVKAEMNGVSVANEGFLSRTNNFISKWGGMIAGAAATFAGLALSVNKFKDYALDIEDAKANLSSLTGLKGEDLEEMGRRAEKMSTTTTEAGVRITKSAKDILDAYTLMGSAKPELLKDKDALAAVTKEGLTLAEAAKMETKPAIESLATVMNQFSLGSDQASRTVNVLAAGSQAGAEEVDGLAESIKNFGPAAKGANVSLEQSVALVEALSEKGIKGAESGTGLRNFLLTLQSGADETNPKVVGLDKALDNLASKNLSAAEMVKKFGKENYVTASLIIENRDRVNELTKAVTGTNTAYEQANTNTDTTRAKLAQSSNEFMLQAKVLGEKLAPAMSGVTNLGTKFLKVLIEFPTIIKVMTPAVVGLTAAWIAHELSLSNSTKAARLYITVNNLLSKSISGIKSMFATNPVTSWIAVIGIATSAILAFVKGIERTKAPGEDFIKNLNVEKTAAKDAFEALQKTKEGTDARREAIRQINDKYGSYMKNMLTEKSTLQDIKKAYDEVIDSMTKKIFLQSRDDELNDATKNYQEQMKEKSDSMLDLVKQVGRGKGEIYASAMYNSIMEGINNGNGKKIGGIFKELYKQFPELETKGTGSTMTSFGIVQNDSPQWKLYRIAQQVLVTRQEYKKKVKGILSSFDALGKGLKIDLAESGYDSQDSGQPVEDSSNATGDSESKSDEKFNKEKEALEKWFREKQNMYKQQYLQEKIDKSKFDAEMYSLELTRLLRLKALGKKYGKDISETEGQYLDKRISFREKANDMAAEAQRDANSFLADVTKEGYDGLEKLLEEHHKEMQKRIDDNYSDVEKNEEYEQKQREEDAKNEYEAKKQQYENFRQLSDDFAQSFGSLMSDFITDQEMTQADFANGLLMIGLDTLHNVVRMAIAQIWAGAMASPESIASWGVAGAAKAAGMSVLVETAFAVAKALIRKPTAQRADGKYDVLAIDGNTYRAQVLENPGTGIYSTPTLFAEKGGELIVDNKTLNRVLLNAPWAIEEIMRLRVPQRAEGKYDSVVPMPPTRQSQDNSKLEKAITALVDRLNQPFEAFMLSSNARSVMDREDMIKGKARRNG